MTENEREKKLEYISRLNRGELYGWVWAHQYDSRNWFHGELDALKGRARALGTTLEAIMKQIEGKGGKV